MSFTEADRRSQRERMLAGDPYIATDPELQQLSRRAMRLIEQYNRTSVDEPELRRRILADLLGYVGEGVEVHPTEPEPRRAKLEAARAITIGNNVWLGGGAIVCPGVSIGDNTVVGAGAVVTRNLPANVVAVGNPARVIRSF
jgi:maltose O-acetyltransferase